MKKYFKALSYREVAENIDILAKKYPRYMPPGLHAKADGSVIFFASNSTNKLRHEIDYYFIYPRIYFLI